MDIYLENTESRGKGKPYDESPRVPFVISFAGVVPRVDEHLVAPSLDIGPTTLELAGIDMKADGLSLVKLFNEVDADWRSDLLVENLGHRLTASGLDCVLK